MSKNVVQIMQMRPAGQIPKPNPEHLAIIKQGVKAWNEWRRKNPQIKPDLSSADFQKADLSRVNFSNTKLSQVNFEYARLNNADFAHAELSRTKLGYAKIEDAEFRGAKLIMSDIRQTDFMRSKFFRTRFSGTEIHSSDFTYTSFHGAEFDSSYLMGSDFSHSDFRGAKIVKTLLTGSNFKGVTMGETSISNTDLGEVKGLDSIIHEMPSSIGVDTLCFSSGKIPDKFLRDAGVPETLITYLPSLRGAMEPIQWHSCFISYSTKDDEFSKRLHSRMRQAGLRVWFAPEDMKGGDYFLEQIERAIQLHDRLLLVLSEDSIQSKWVEREIRKTRKIERTEKRRKLFPITLTDYATLKKWECLDSDTGEDLAEEVRKYHIPDFSNWKNHDAFERAFARLEKDLRTSIGK